MKTEILKLLREQDGYLSGQQICETLGVSRTAVWKVMNQLKEEGYQIEAVPNKGYHLLQTPDILSVSEIESRLTTDHMARKLYYYDGWFSGGSEFFVKCGAIESFKARTEEEMDDYNPQITDFMIKVRRKQVGNFLRFNSILVSEWSDQLSECAFMVVEDDGGKMTKWSAAGTVKIKSRSYGFEVAFPYHRSDDIVWRGKLSDNYLERNSGRAARFGDVSITFD